MDDCIFCKIVKGEIPSYSFWENETHMAFLDIFPNTKGMTLVIPKKHFDSYVFKMEDKDFVDLFKATKEVTKILEKGLEVKRVAMVMEGLGVNHAHIKLYPLYGLEKEFQESWASEKIYFDKYQGYISTQIGERAKDNELDELKKHLITFSEEL